MPRACTLHTAQPGHANPGSEKHIGLGGRLLMAYPLSYEPTEVKNQDLGVGHLPILEALAKATWNEHFQ